MVLQAVILPPRPAVEAAAAVVARVRDDRASPPSAPAPRRGLLGGRRQAPGPPRDPLQVHDAALARLPVTSFGKVTAGDADRLVAAVAAALAGTPPPLVRFAGGLVLEPLGDDQVWVRVQEVVARGGQAAAGSGLRDLPRAVVTAVERVGFFCDRRAFRPELPLARVTDQTTEGDLEAVLAALEAFAGEPWAVDHVALVERSREPGRLPDRELARVPVGPA